MNSPRVGLYGSFAIATVIAFTGGRPAMISAATGAMTLLMVTLVRDHGLEYLLAATVLTGMLQTIAGVVRLGALMRFVSRSVITGFVNALAILIFLAQIPEIAMASPTGYAAPPTCCVQRRSQRFCFDSTAGQTTNGGFAHSPQDPTLGAFHVNFHEHGRLAFSRTTDRRRVHVSFVGRCEV